MLTMEPRPINYPQALEHDFDAVVHVVPPGAAFSPYNPCCTGAFYGWDCTTDCTDQRLAEYLSALSSIAWEAYSKAWPEAMSMGCVVYLGGGGVRTTLAHPVSLDWGDAP